MGFFDGYFVRWDWSLWGLHFCRRWYGLWDLQIGPLFLVRLGADGRSADDVKWSSGRKLL